MSTRDQNALTHRVAQAAGLGLIAGGLEAVGLAAALPAPVGFVGFIAVGVSAMIGMAVLAGALAVPLTWLSRAAYPDAGAVRQGTVTLGAVGGLLCGWYLWEAAWILLGQGRLPSAVLFAMVPGLFYLIASYNARYWLRRAANGHPGPPWLPVAAAAGAALTLGGAVAHALSDTGGHGALAGDPSVIVVTVPALNAPPDAAGVTLTQAITPSPDRRVALASLWTGLHPLRTGVVTPAQVLAEGHQTVAEAFAKEGYATAAFTSSTQTRRDSGLAQGFLIYDDLTGGLLGTLRLTSIGRRLLPRPPARSGDAVLTAFRRWHRAHLDLPHFAWIELPDAAHLPDVLETVDAAGVADDTLIVVAGTGGDGLGLGDDQVRVPLWFRAPGRDTSHPVVDRQVRLFDLAPTVLEYAQLDNLPVTEGVNLLQYASGVRKVNLPLVLLGRDTAAPHGPIIGFRTQGVLYVHNLQTDAEALYEVNHPGVDVSAVQADATARARAMIAPDTGNLRRLLDETP